MSEEEQLKFRDLVNLIASIMNNNIKIKDLNIPLAFTIASIPNVFKKMFKIPLDFNIPMIKDMSSSWKVDIKEVKKSFDYLPSVSLSEGLTLTIDWYKINGFLK